VLMATGKQMTNGQTQHHAQLGGSPSVPPAMTPDTPILQIAPLALSTAQLRWMFGAIIGGIWSAYLAGWLFLPAKDSDVQSLRGVVQIVQQEQEKSRDTLNRLTLAVDNLSGIVDRLSNAPRQELERLVPRAAAKRVSPR
jgi:hypothetical protein